MHPDEAVNAEKLGVLLEKGKFEYSTLDYHGPSLYYVSLIAARVQGIQHFVDLNETTLRAVPVIFGILLVAAHYFLIPYLGLAAAAASALLTAVSPAMVYYSRYFIHEMLFVALTFAWLLTMFAWYGRRSVGWAIAAGAILGLMFATKETLVLPAACALVAGLLQGKIERPTVAALLWAAAAGVLVALLLMSSFFTNPQGIVDSVLAYDNYLQRGAGTEAVHNHSWNFYLDRLFWFHVQGGPVFTELLIGVLALVGGAIASEQRGVPRFLAIYGSLLMLLYCLLPYKTPWSILGALHGMILLAGIGAASLAQRVRTPAVVAGLLLVGAGHLGWQAHAESSTYRASPRNPWVYAHTSEDIFTILKKLDALTAADPTKLNADIQIFTQENFWPLPWYLRRYSNIHWWNGVLDSNPLAPIILASPDMEPALLHRMYEVPPPGQREMYMNIYEQPVYLRPTIEVRGYVAKSAWDRWQESR